MPKARKASKRKPTEPGPPKTEAEPLLHARFFATHPGVTEEIESWASREGVKIRKVVPVYWEGV